MVQFHREADIQLLYFTEYKYGMYGGKHTSYTNLRHII